MLKEQSNLLQSRPLLSNNLYMFVLCDLNFNFPSVFFILVKPVFNDHLSYVTLFQCSLHVHIRQV